MTHPKPHHDNLKHAYTDSAGNHYFEFIHDASMPHKRFLDAQVTEKLVRLGMSEKALRDIISACKALSIDGERTAEQLRTDMLTISANIEGRLGYLTGHQTYMQYASVFYLLEGEPLEPSDAWHLKKFDLWHNDEAARDFFLHGAFKKLHNLMTISIEDMQSSFKAAEIREQSLPTLPKK